MTAPNDISRNISPHKTVVLLLFAVCGGICGIAAAVVLFFILNSPADLAVNTANINADYRSIPESLITYHETKAFYCNPDNTLLEPGAFAASRSGISFIADKGAKKIFVFDIDGKRLPDILLDNVPLALTVADNNFLYIAFQKRIDVFYIQGGKVISSFPAATASSIISLSVSDTAVFAVDSNGIICRYNKETGMLEKTFGGLAKNKTKSSNGEETADFTGFVIYRSPITLAVSPKTGLLYVTNPGRHRIEAFTPVGHWESSLSWGFFSAKIDGFTGCCNPTGIAVLDDGRIITSEKAIPRVKIYKTDGTLYCVIAAAKVLEAKPENIPEIKELPQRTAEQNRDIPPLFAACGEDRILIFDSVLKIVRVFEKNDNAK